MHTSWDPCKMKMWALGSKFKNFKTATTQQGPPSLGPGAAQGLLVVDTGQDSRL